MNILAFGEIMMRLSVPDYKFLTQTNELNYVITGTGLNILSGLKNFGYNTYMLTKLPNNNVGKASSANIRKLGVKDDFITYGGNHIGVYFLESGYGERPSEVTYLNRLNSSFCESKLQDYDINKCLEGIDVVHICGIAMQLTDSVKEIALELSKKSYEKGIKVFFDFNFRQSLNPKKTYDDLVDDYKKILPYCHGLFASYRDINKILNIDNLDIKSSSELIKKEYDIDIVAGTMRRFDDMNNRFIRGYISNNDGYFESREYKLEIYDRVGAGDGYVAGIIYSYLENMSNEDIVEFGVASSVLAHTTYGDNSLVSTSHVFRLMNNEKVDILR